MPVSFFSAPARMGRRKPMFTLLSLLPNPRDALVLLVMTWSQTFITIAHFNTSKVSVSGLHRSARFQVIGPHNDKPVFFDDASYYLSFEREDDARLIADVLNSAPGQLFISSLVFPDSKRPITVELLQRLNLAAI